MQLSFGNCLGMEGRVETGTQVILWHSPLWGAHREGSSGMREHLGRPCVMITEGTVMLGVSQGKRR